MASTFDHAIIVRRGPRGRAVRIRVDVDVISGDLAWSQSGAPPEFLRDNVDLADALRDTIAADRARHLPPES